MAGSVCQIDNSSGISFPRPAQLFNDADYRHVSRSILRAVRYTGLTLCLASVAAAATGAFDPALPWTGALLGWFAAYFARILALEEVLRPVPVANPRRELTLARGMKGQREALDRAA